LPVQRQKLAQCLRIAGTVVDDDDLEIAEGLARQRGHQPVEEVAAVEARHNDADCGRRLRRRAGALLATNCCRYRFSHASHPCICWKSYRAAPNIPLKVSRKIRLPS